MERRNFFAALAATCVAPFVMLKAKPRDEFDWPEFLDRDRKKHPPADDPNIHLKMHAEELKANPMWVMKDEWTLVRKPLKDDPTRVIFEWLAH